MDLGVCSCVYVSERRICESVNAILCFSCSVAQLLLNVVFECLLV